MKKLAFLLSLCLVGLVLPARATTIGPGGCGSCLGSSYTLDYQTTGSSNVFDVFLQINASGFTNSNTDRLNAVSLKLVPQASDITDVHLIGTIPTGFSGGAGGTISGGLSANGCDGSGGGFFCSQTTASNHGLEVGHAGDIYTFEWQVTLANASALMLGANADSVKALYVTSGGQQNGITSEEIGLTQGVPTPTGPPSVIPEPSSLLLLGTGMVGVASALRRKLVTGPEVK